jgi:hypothetical protein
VIIIASASDSVCIGTGITSLKPLITLRVNRLLTAYIYIPHSADINALIHTLIESLKVFTHKIYKVFESQSII